MKCDTCGFENSEGAQFCGSCGVPLETRAGSAESVSYCTACGTENPAGARFCGSCGAGMRVSGGPAAEPEPAQADVPRAYMGFWIRFAALVIDWIILGVVGFILVLVTDGSSLFVQWLINILYFVLFTGLQGQTPGKMAVGIKVVTWQGEVPGVGRASVRFIGEIVSFVVIFLGVIWIAFDRQKQGWHDKMASTYVVKK